MVCMVADSAESAGGRALDLGCGEGKNSAYLAQRGYVVEAWDISAAALSNARSAWPDAPVSWLRRDALSVSAETRSFDLVVAYGLYHCLAPAEIAQTIAHVKRITAPDGYNIVACFNDRQQVNFEAAHPGFLATCLPHETYVASYAGWQVLDVSDEDLDDWHPTTMVDHTHSITRIVAMNRPCT
jgi:SAM-dependent methyltransferase